MDAPTEFVFLQLGTVLQLMITHLKRNHIDKVSLRKTKLMHIFNVLFRFAVMMCFKYRLINVVWKLSIVLVVCNHSLKTGVIVIFKPKCSFNRNNASPIDRFTKLVLYFFISIAWKVFMFEGNAPKP